MRAILLCAGKGTRLRPYTNDIPKCLMTINGKPLLQIWLERLTSYGINQFLINTHYLSDKVKKFINESEFKKRIKLVYEPKLLGTAGTLLSNINFFHDEDGMLIHADNYCLADFSCFMKCHKERPKNCDITMMTFKTEEASNCGIVIVDKDNIVKSFHEKSSNPPGNLANGAVYILSKKSLHEIKNTYKNSSDFSLEIIPKFINRIFTYEVKETHIDIGTIKNYRKANEFI